MPNILILGLNFHPEPTGIGKYTGELAAYLAAQGHRVRVITTPPYYPHWQVGHGYRAARYQKEIWENVEVYRCPLWVPRRPTGLTRLVHLASFALSSLPVLTAQRNWKPDLILTIAPALMNAPFALSFARFNKIPAWLHIQDFELDAALKLGMLPGGKGLANLAARFERALLNGFNRVSTISNAMLSKLGGKGIPQQKTVLFPNWVDTEKIHPLDDTINQLRSSLNLPPETVIVLYAGTMGKKQGLEDLIAVAKRLQSREDIRFILCGDGVARPSLMQAASGLGNLQFLPVQPIEALNQLLNMADIHILLQKADAADLVMPSKLSGMFASGKAVIATAHVHTELGRVVQEAGILTPPEDVDALEKAILRLAESPVLRSELGNKGRAYALRNWDTKIILREFEHSLAAMLSSKTT